MFSSMFVIFSMSGSLTLPNQCTIVHLCVCVFVYLCDLWAHTTVRDIVYSPKNAPITLFTCPIWVWFSVWRKLGGIFTGCKKKKSSLKAIFFFSSHSYSHIITSLIQYYQPISHCSWPLLLFCYIVTCTNIILAICTSATKISLYFLCGSKRTAQWFGSERICVDVSKYVPPNITGTCFNATSHILWKLTLPSDVYGIYVFFF